MDALDLLDDNNESKPATGLAGPSRRRNRENNDFKSLLT